MVVKISRLYFTFFLFTIKVFRAPHTGTLKGLHKALIVANFINGDLFDTVDGKKKSPPGGFLAITCDHGHL